MINDVFSTEKLSTNIYTKQYQILRRIVTIKAILANNEFSNEVLYTTETLRDNLKYYNSLLAHVELTIKIHEKQYFTFSA